MTLRPTAIVQAQGGAKGLYVAIDDPDTTGVLLIPCSFEHRRVVTRVELEDGFELHPARCSTQQPGVAIEGDPGQRFIAFCTAPGGDGDVWFEDDAEDVICVHGRDCCTPDVFRAVPVAAAPTQQQEDCETCGGDGFHLRFLSGYTNRESCEDCNGTGKKRPGQQQLEQSTTGKEDCER